MSRNRRTRTQFVVLLLGALCITVLVGCNSGEKGQHEQWVDQANNRWLGLRSNMMLKMAQQQFETGDLELAERSIQDALQLDPKNDKLHVLAGRIALEQGQLERSYQRFELAQKFNEENADAYYYQGLVLQRWQRYDEAQSEYEKAYEIKPDEEAYLLATAEMMVERDQVDAALTKLTDKLNYFDQSAALRAQVGQIYKLKNRPDKAVPFFEQAALMDPDNIKLETELALSQFAAGQNKDAIATLESLLNRPKMQKRRDLRRTLARAYLEIGRKQKARTTYLELARSEHGQPSDWLRLGQLAWQAKDLGGALQAANRVIELAPQRHEGYLLAGMVWQERGRLDDALSMFDRAAQRAEDRAEPLILRGLSLQRAGRDAAAREAYRRALQRNPNDRRARRLLQSLSQATP